MEFSIIVPSYNSSKTIERCVKSVIDQTFEDYELIIVDDGSDDNSIDLILQSLESIKHKIIRQKNQGVSAARNKGLEIAEGKYVLFLDSDDEIVFNALELFYEHIIKNNAPDILFCGFYKIYPNIIKSFCLERNQSTLLDNKTNHDFNPYISRLIGTVWGKCYKRKIIDRFRFNDNLAFCEDAEFNFRVFQNAESYFYVNYNLYKYYYYSNSTIRKYDKKAILRYEVAATTILDLKLSNLRLSQSRYEFLCTVLNLICFNLIFSNANSDSFSQKTQLLKMVCESTIFYKVLYNIDLSRLPTKHRLTIALLKHRCYILIPFIAFVNRLINYILYGLNKKNRP